MGEIESFYTVCLSSADQGKRTGQSPLRKSKRDVRRASKESDQIAQIVTRTQT